MEDQSSSSNEDASTLTNNNLDPHLQDKNLSKKDIEFYNGFSKVSKKGSSVIKRN